MKTAIKILILYYSLIFFDCYSQEPGWDALSVGVWGELKSIHFINQYDLYMCGDLLLNYKSTDSGTSWQVNQYSTPTTMNDIFVIDQNIILAVGNAGTILRTTNGGNSWSTINSGVTDNLLSVSFVDSFGICGARSQTIIYTSDAGASWNIAQSGWLGGGFWGAVMLSSEIGFVAGENSIFQPLLGSTINSGMNWDYHAFYLNNNEGRATGVDFTDINIGYVSARVWNGPGAISKTTDSGSNWITTFFNNPLWSIDFPISNASQVGYAVGDSCEIYKTYDAGLNWLPQQSGFTLKLNRVYFIDLDYGFAVGENGIILGTTTGGEPVTMVENGNHLPNTYQLLQNYPNPFNPSTKIQFAIPSVTLSGVEESPVTLKVYDVLGNEITTLVNEELLAGEYEVEFNAINLPSGIYFYQLKAGSFIQTKKMILLK